jgi:hypothetical protein
MRLNRRLRIRGQDPLVKQRLLEVCEQIVLLSGSRWETSLCKR